MSDDTISRKATIDAIEGVDWYHIDSDGQLTHGANSKEHEPLYKAKDVYKVLNAMPSAQPEIIRCRDCSHFHEYEWYCEAWNNSPGFPKVTEDGFCNLAERRTDG